MGYNINMKLIFLSTFIFLIASCGSRDIQYNEFNDTVLDGLKKKKQNECLASKGSIIQSWRDSWATVFDSSATDIRRKYTFEYNIDAEDDTTHKINLYITSKPDEETIVFIAENENAIDSTATDAKLITYTKELHDDHVQLLVAEACIADNPTITENQIIYEINSTNKTDRYELTNEYPALFARYFSLTKEVRQNDTENTRGEITKAITLKAPTSILLGSDFSTTTENCNLAPIAFDDNAGVPGAPTLSTSTVISALGIREENGMDGCP